MSIPILAGVKPHAPAMAAIGTGILLFPLLAFLDREARLLVALAGAGPGSAVSTLAPVLVEEATKCLLVFAFVRLVGRPERGAAFSIVSICVFAALENLAYARAFGGSDILMRLLWASPVHLVSALALAIALGAPARRSKGGNAAATARGRFLPSTAFAFALGWHGSANLIASAGPSPVVLVAGSLANLIALVVLSRFFFTRIVIGGQNHGT